MAKRKHPSPRTIRQGQTLYILHTDWEGYWDYIVRPVVSHNSSEPEIGEASRVVTPFTARRTVAHLSRYIYYSRRRAASECRRLNDLQTRRIATY